MRLYLNKTSPYARLAAVVVHEKGLAEKVDPVWIDPWASPPDLLAVNPLARVPTLVTDSGLSITDSACICTYLDDIGHGPRLLPSEMKERLPALMKYGLGRGLIDLAFGVTIERRYAISDSKPFLAERWLAAVQRTITALEQDQALRLSHEHPDIGDLAITAALAYVGFRLPEAHWPNHAPKITKWFARISERASIYSTKPE